jgi:dephospho-CoA kinase
MQLRIGLTGGIGSGKTTVARIFEVLGIPVYYADDAAKRLMNTNADLRKSIINAFGENAYSGIELNRNYIASLVFADKEKLALLNALTHPVTINDANEWMAEQTSPYTIKEAALIFEAGSNKHLDLVIGVSSPLDLRIKRVSARDKVTTDVVEARIARQMNEEAKMKLCDYVIKNDETELMIPQILRLHDLFLARMAKEKNL